MGPSQHAHRCSETQAPLCHPRSRECLLEGCGRRFTPPCARSCYCREACRQAARRWSQRKAQERYRRSEQGRARRREQSRRWRERHRQKEKGVEKGSCEPSVEPCEGHQQEPRGKKIVCHRPGCYATFLPSGRSPRQRFCSSRCQHALRRAWLREQRWRDTCLSCPRRAADPCVAPRASPELTARY